MNQSDWVSETPAPAAKPFKDIRSTRPSVAEEKAQLVLQLGALIRTVPAAVRNGSVDVTREWKAIRDKAEKVARNARSSAQEIRTAINSLNRYS